MPAATLPPDEPDRLAALRRLGLLDTEADVVFDALTELARSLAGTAGAAVSLLDADREWFKSVRGLDLRELPRDASFCAHAILQPNQALVVEDATRDPRFADNPLVTGEPGIRFYAAMPLADDAGHALGVLSIFDRQPRAADAQLLRRLEQVSRGAAAALNLYGAVQGLGRQPTVDGLTGLANRATFDRVVAEACAEARGPEGNGAALLFLDLDGFQGLNDVFGHSGGDRILQEVARRLHIVARAGDLVARLDADHFALLCRGLTSPKAALAVATRVHAAMADPFRLDSQTVRLRASIGVACVPRHAEDAEALVREADAALYQAKQAARSTTRMAGPTSGGAPDGPAVLGRLTLGGLLRDALLPPGREPFHLHFQPILDLRTGKTTTFEALVRWTLPDGRGISPSDFVTAAETAGLVAHLDHWVLRKACATAAHWPEPWGVSVNLSPAAFALLDVPALVRDAVAGTGLPPARLRLEVTETMRIPDPNRMSEAVHSLRALGITVAMDDFGSGYASLSRLREYAFDAVKLDRSLVTGLGTDTQALPLLRSLRDLTRHLGIRVVAEGVETSAQLVTLRDLGIDRVQGYLLSRPVPDGEVATAAAIAEQRLALGLDLTRPTLPEPA